LQGGLWGRPLWMDMPEERKTKKKETETKYRTKGKVPQANHFMLLLKNAGKKSLRKSRKCP